MSLIGTIRNRLLEHEFFQRRQPAGAAIAGLPDQAGNPVPLTIAAKPGGGEATEKCADAVAASAGNLIFREENRNSPMPLSYGTSLDSRPDGKIVVFGLPKSGNVWLVSLLCDYTASPPVDPITAVDRPGVGMCHFPYDDFMAQRCDFLHAVYLVRDIRDIIVSYFHNGQTKWFRDDFPNFHYETIDEFYFEWFLPRIVPRHQIHTHADAYLGFGVPVIRYERLCDEPEREFGRLIKRLGLPYDEDRVRQCVAKNRIEKLRAEGRMLHTMVPPTHFRKGGYGHYKTELPGPVLQHANSEFRDLIVKWGYPI